MTGGRLQRAGRWIEYRTGLGRALRPLLDHRVPAETARLPGGLAYVLGVALLATFVLQAVTGVALATVYVPSAENAYDSLRFISNEAPAGRLLRGLHYIGASAMVVLMLAHMARVFLTGSYKFPREVNWIIGVGLLFLTLGMALTGQLLRWDQDSVWSTIIAVQQAGRVPLIGGLIGQFMLGGETLGALTLSRFFALHVFIIPGLMLLAVAVHLFLVYRNGISELPRAGRRVQPGRRYRVWYRRLLRREGTPYFPWVAWRDAAAALLAVVVVFVLALAVGPKPLGELPDPTALATDPRPDWYFLWYFTLFATLPPLVQEVFFPVAPLVVAALLLALPFVAPGGERAPQRRPLAVLAVAGAVVFLGFALTLGVRAPWVPALETEPVDAARLGLTGPAVSGAHLFHEAGCQYCHVVAGQGGGRGPDLTHAVRRVGEAGLRAPIWNGPGEMPSYNGILTEVEAGQIVAFLMQLDQALREPDPDRTQPE